MFDLILARESLAHLLEDERILVNADDSPHCIYHYIKFPETHYHLHCNPQLGPDNGLSRLQRVFMCLMNVVE